MDTIDTSLSAWMEAQKAEEYEVIDILFALKAGIKQCENTLLVDEARKLFGETAAQELAAKLAQR